MCLQRELRWRPYDSGRRRGHGTDKRTCVACEDQFPKARRPDEQRIMLYKNLQVPASDLDGLMTEVNINVGGVIRTTSAFVDILRANRGTIINVSSALAFIPLSSAPIYSATKAAVHSYTQSLRFQLEEFGVEVIELMPPAVKTALSADLPEGGLVSLITVDELLEKTSQRSKGASSRSDLDRQIYSPLCGAWHRIL